MKNKIAILIADDNIYIREALNVLVARVSGLRLAGEAKNGQEAIAMAANLLRDIILLDVNMSSVNGFEACRGILKKNPGIKIIGLSLHDDYSYARNMMKMGAKGYLSKNASYSEMLEAINEVARGGQYIFKALKGMP